MPSDRGAGDACSRTADASFCVINLGCKVNRIDADVIIAELEASGLKRTSPELASVCIVNTCTVTAEADSKVRKAIRQAAARECCAAVIATGCSAVLNSDAFAALSCKVRVVADRAQAAKLAKQLLGSFGEPAHGSRIEQGECSLSGTADKRMGSGFNTRVGVKVQDGCSNACTYCIVPKVRGRARSKPMAEAVGEVRSAVRAGAKEVVVSGINVGAWRDPQNPDAGLEALLAELASVEGDFRIRLSSVEPQDVSEELISLIADSKGRICRHLHLPLQSGSSSVLSQMGRRYDASMYLRLVATLRSAMPQVALTTDVIVGFPGETEADFHKTCELARACAFSGMHVFKYSPRPNTPAASLAALPPPVVAERSRALRELACAMAAADRNSRIGMPENALMETDCSGRLESYHMLHLPSQHRQGELLDVVVTGCGPNNTLIGKLTLECGGLPPPCP